MKWKILIIEDDFLLSGQIAASLQQMYEVRCLHRFDHVLSEVGAYEPDLVLLDINLPVHDGFYWCERIRSVSHLPIVFITSRAETADTVKAIRLGGDDYIVKPFRLELLEAKIQAALRRNEEYQKPKIVELAPGLTYNMDLQSLRLHGTAIELTPTEKKLFHALVRKKGALVSRTELMLALWDTDQFIEEGTLTTSVSRLRHKLSALTGHSVIVTSKGKGYYIE